MANANVKDRAVLFLEAKMTGANPALKSELENGNIVIRDHKLYVNKAILVGSNNLLELVDKTLSKTVGSTSFEKGKTEEDIAMGVTGMIARFAPSVASNDVTNQPYSEFLYDYAGALRIPKEIQNADVEVTVGSLKIYEGRLGNLFVNGRESNKNGDCSQYLELKAPKFIKGGQEVQVTVRMPNGITVPGTATQYVHLQFEFDGVATSTKL